MNKRISVVIPAYNEEEMIGKTVRAASSIPGVVQVLVVDDGSTDDTGRQALGAGGEVIVTGKNLGKGQALGLALSKVNGEIILFLDGDLGESASKGAALIDPVLSDEADMTIAKFPPSKHRGGFGLTLGLARLGTWILTGIWLESPLSGQRAFSTRALQLLAPPLPGFGVEVGFNVRAARKGLRVQEIPVSMEHRNTGRNAAGFRHRGRQFWHIILALGRLLKHS